MLKYGYLAGLITPVWLVIGVAIAGSLYPGYSHLNQAMSELGALGAPTHELSPLINNFPLGVLFVVFGIAVFAVFKGSALARSSGVLIVLHGVASLCTGYFSCDVGCGLEHPSDSQNLHNLSGMVMFLTLLLASTLWIYLATRVLGLKWFAWFSLACTLVALLVLPLMGQAVAAGEGFGLYQRINYGASILWVGVFAWVLKPMSSTH
ncbi:DUF998 domain-containing protein [Pseudomonas sp. H11T01]|uniref:DUF998 domain-containing protein n=1 Tax=Pseudomonas sp. H11T01 TaxID=3402749 RepID=UPI003AC36A8D